MGGYYTQQRLKNYAKKLKPYFGLESSLIRPVAKGIWYDKLGGNLPPFFGWVLLCQRFWLKLVTKKNLLANVYFTDQNTDAPNFSVFLLEPYNVLWISS